MKKLLTGLGVFFVVLIAGLMILPFVIPKSTYRNVIESRLETALGRDVTFENDPTIQFFPQIGVRFDGVTIANAEGFTNPHFAKAEEMAVSVKWLPLLSRKIEIASANFIGTEILLEEDAKGNVNWVFTPENAPEETEAKPESQSGGFDALIPEARLKNSRVSYVSKAKDLSYDVTDIDMTASLSGLSGPVKFNGSLTVNGQPFQIDGRLTSLQNLMDQAPFELVADIKSDLASASYDGQITLGDAPLLNGNFTGDISKLGALLKFASVKTDLDLSEIGRITAKGKISGTPDNLNLQEIEARQDGKIMSASYTGNARVSETIILDGRFSGKVTDLVRAAKIADIDLEPEISGLGTITTNGHVSGTPDNLNVLGVNVEQAGNLLNSSFQGSVKVGKTIVPVGAVTLKSSNVKGLAKAFGVTLEGTDNSAYRALNTRLDLSETKGGFKGVISEFQFDDIAASGNTTVNLSGKTPFITVDLTLPKVNLAPYLVEGKDGAKPGDPSDGWSEDTLDLSALQSVNGDFRMSIGSLSNAEAELLDVNFEGKLRNGVLTGSLLSTAPEGGRTGQPSRLNPLYNGDLATSFIIADRPGQPVTLSFTAKGSGIAAADLVKFFTGQNVLRGVANLDASASTRGDSMSDFVKNLDGSYKADVADGAIIGVNLPQLLRSAQDALTTGKLPAALSPSAETDFASLDLNGTISHGTANIEVFRLLSPFLRAEATGTVDLFNQTLDVRLQPRAIAQASGQGSEFGINGIGIPLRINGSWNKISGSLDMDYMSKLLADQAKSKLRNQLGNSLNEKLGDELGGILGGVLGTPKTETITPPTGASPVPEGLKAAPTEAESAETTKEEEKKKDPEEEAKELIKNLIFGD